MKKSEKSKKKSTKEPRKKEEKTSSSSPIFIAKNVGLLIVVYLLLQGLKENNVGYQWVFESLVKQNLEQQEQYQELTNDQKLEAKLGFAVRYLNMINENTPEDAIILMGPDSILCPPTGKPFFQKVILKKGWANYWVYPRRLVYEEDKEEFPELYEQATHVAITNFWGYDRLSYPVAQQQQFLVMPINAEQ